MALRAPRRRGLIAAAAFASTLALATAARALDGVPDANFGGDGVVTTPLASGSDGENPADVALQSDGKIVAAGFVDQTPGGGTNHDFTLVRYNADGSLDDGGDGPSGAGFGGDGIVTTDVSPQANDLDRVFGVAIQPADGKIVVAGDSQSAGGDSDFTVARYHTDGSLDSTTDADPGTALGTTGVVTTPVAPSMGNDTASDVAIQGDGKIVAAGSADFGGTTDDDLTLVRYNANGTLDGDFDGDPGNPGGGNGIVATDFSGDTLFDTGRAVAIQPSDGKIVAAADVARPPNGDDSTIGLARYNPANGTLDTGFDGPGGGDGKFTTSFGGSSEDSRGLVIQPADGKIVVAGGANVPGPVVALARYLSADGGLDPDFDGDPGNAGGGNGKVTTSIGSGNSRASGVTVAPDGKLVVAGSADSDPTAATNTDFAVARYHAANGTLDSGFAGDGTVFMGLAPGSNFDAANEAAVQSDGKVIAFGTADFGAGATGFDFTLLRLGPEPPVPVAPTPVMTPATAPPFDLAAAVKRCKKKYPKGPKRKKCIRKAKRKAAAT